MSPSLRLADRSTSVSSPSDAQALLAILLESTRFYDYRVVSLHSAWAADGRPSSHLELGATQVNEDKLAVVCRLTIDSEEGGRFRVMVVVFFEVDRPLPEACYESNVLELFVMTTEVHGQAYDFAQRQVRTLAALHETNHGLPESPPEPFWMSPEAALSN